MGHSEKNKNWGHSKGFPYFLKWKIIIVNYKYQGNILLGLLNLSPRKRKWWGFSPIINRCRVWKLKNMGFFISVKVLRYLNNNQINISCRVIESLRKLLFKYAYIKIESWVLLCFMFEWSLCSHLYRSEFNWDQHV